MSTAGSKVFRLIVDGKYSGELVGTDPVHAKLVSNALRNVGLHIEIVEEKNETNR